MEHIRQSHLKQHSYWKPSFQWKSPSFWLWFQNLLLMAAAFNLAVFPEAVCTWHFVTPKEQPLIETHQANSYFCLLWLCFQLWSEADNFLLVSQTSYWVLLINICAVLRCFQVYVIQSINITAVIINTNNTATLVSLAKFNLTKIPATVEKPNCSGEGVRESVTSNCCLQGAGRAYLLKWKKVKAEAHLLFVNK